MNYLYLYSDWAGPNPESGRDLTWKWGGVTWNGRGFNRYVILSMQLIWVDQKIVIFIAD